jgi:hypothetical protein
VERNKENASKKNYHHTLGQGGYKLAIPKWQKMEQDLMAKGIRPTTIDWPKRSRTWYYAHCGSLNLEDGNLIVGERV